MTDAEHKHSIFVERILRFTSEVRDEDHTPVWEGDFLNVMHLKLADNSVYKDAKYTCRRWQEAQVRASQLSPHSMLPGIIPSEKEMWESIASRQVTMVLQRKR